ncbi:MAG: alpha/beta hydrolase [Crocinitomicaceae bacterium]|nr:alpha/beta hydrolase [Crocinitomicaceae bacterium]
MKHRKVFQPRKSAGKNLIVALHGYGQLASYFIQKFEFLDPEKYFVIAPEGLHRFYLNGTSGRVGASWMTKENREDDITNYLQYLNALLEKIIIVNPYYKKHLIGFSQGGATASRLIGSGRFKFDAFLLWAAVFPPDMNRQKIGNFSGSKNYLIIGDEDPYYSVEVIVHEQEKLKETGMKFEVIHFNGKHTIHSETLKKILHEI